MNRYRSFALLVLAPLALLSASCQQHVVQAHPDAYAGVGLDLGANPEGPVVRAAIDGGAAQHAGFAGGERIVSINGIPTRGMALASAVAKLRGAPGTAVEVLYDDAKGNRQRVRLVRQPIRKEGEGYVAH